MYDKNPSIEDENRIMTMMFQRKNIDNSRMTFDSNNDDDEDQNLINGCSRNEEITSYDELLVIQEKCLMNAKQFKYKKNANFVLRNSNLTTLNKELQQQKRSIMAANRLSCEELEDLKERFVDFIKLDKQQSVGEQHYDIAANEQMSPGSTTTGRVTPKLVQQLNSKSCAHLSFQKLKPEPPERTVSIRHSTIYTPSEMLTSEDTFTIKSTYSNYMNASSSCASSTTSTSSSSSVSASSSLHQQQPLRSCKSVFSINEDQSSMLIKTERLHENEIHKIQAMYRSVNCIILVSSCTVDYYTTNSEQIASLQDCWKIELNAVVPVWIFDRSYKRQKEKCLKLLFVDKLTGFPVYKEILISKLSQFKNPKDRRLTFTVGNFICLINFHDYFSCNEFYKFFLELQVYLYESRAENCFSELKGRSKSRDTRRVNQQHLANVDTPLLKFTDDTNIGKIKKNCISNPCAFQHFHTSHSQTYAFQRLIKDNVNYHYMYTNDGYLFRLITR